MYYPLITIPAFLLAKRTLKFRISGIILGPLLVTPFIIYSSNEAKKISGVSQFPPILGGWQWANNALYMREYIQEDSTQFPNSEMAELDKLARKYYRIVPPANRELTSYVGNFFIKEWDAPLKIYMKRHYKDTLYDGVAAWAKVAPLFGNYGLFLIKRHPLPFIRHYIIVNSKNYFIPPLEKLEIYNLGEDQMSPRAARWFDYPNLRVKVVSKTFHGYLLAGYPLFFLLLNVCFVWNLFIFIKKRIYKNTETNFLAAISIISSLIILNAAFSILANIVVFRYQIFPMITLLAIVLILNDQFDEMRKTKINQSNM
jgi:hypothetical protein